MRPRVLLAVAALVTSSSVAYAIDGPSPGAVSASKVKLPDGPSSVKGLGSTAEVHVASAQVEYSVPIEVPQANGLAPALSLGYRGDLGNGPLGVGWAIDYPTIRRSTRNGVPHFDDSDELEISGIASGRLVRIADGTYRVEGAGNSFRAVRSGNRWTITESNGTIYYFGLTSSSRQEAVVDGELRTYAWFPELVVHLSGKTLAYEYTHDHGQVYLASATWGTSSKYRVDITYQQRNDAVTSYKEGFEVVTGLRASTIRVSSGASVIRTYQLTYDDSLPLTRLQSVSMTGFEGDGALPTVTFTYAPRSGSAPTQMTGLDGWQLEARGVSFFDVDGDGMDDLLRLEAGNHQFRKNLGGTFGPAQSLTGASSIALDQAQLLDLDGDAHAELVRVVDDSWRAYRLDPTQRQWTALGEWPGTRGLPLGGSGVLVDINGDGRTDVVRGTATGLLMNLNGPTGMGPALSLPRISASDVNVEPGLPTVRFTDVNGDGLADVVWITDNWMKWFLGRGDGTFVPWKRVFYPWGPTAIDPKNLLLNDLDRDGLVDLIYFTAGHVAYYAGRPDGSFDAPHAFSRPEAADADVVVTTADANGNGSLDIVWSSPRGMWVLDLAGPATAGMIESIDNGLGETTRFTYQASALLSVEAEQSGQPWLRKLPVSIALPVRSDTEIAGSPTRTVLWGVRDGFWDGTERRFGGFLETKMVVSGATARDTAVTITDYNAGTGADRVLRGRATFVRVQNGLGELLTDTASDWQAFTMASLPGQVLLRRAITRSVVTKQYEGVSSPLSTVKYITVDTEGRPIEEYNAGRIDLTGDETLVTRQYTTDDDVHWIRDHVCAESTYSGDGQTLLTSTRHYFGGPGPQGTAIEPLCTVGLGLERRMQGWLDTQSRWVTLAETDYDANWNPVRTLAEGVERTLGYDSTDQYLTTETIAPSDVALTYTMTWDQVRDLPTSVVDPSGVDTRLTYDALGRTETVALGTHNPHVRYAYDWAAPTPTTTTYTFAGDVAQTPVFPGDYAAGQWRESVSVANGAGESLFEAARLASAQWIISGWAERDTRGRTVTVADPFYWNDTSLTGVAVPPPPHPRQTIEYDAFDRVVRQTLPTGASKTLSYAAFASTTSNDDLAPVSSELDGQGRIRRTSRLVNGVTESVDATYDALGRITAMRLQDGQPNAVQHTYAYDTLGRLVFATDPDIGDRHLAYDDGGHLTQHTNGAGQSIVYTYDSAGRLGSRTAAGVTFTYHYDVAFDPATFLRTQGRLAWVEEPTGRFEVGYDVLGRPTRHRRTVNGQVADEVLSLSATGEQLSIDYLDGVAFDMQYDDAARLIGIGNLWAVDQQDAAGRILQEHCGNGIITTYGRDSLGQPNDIAVTRGTSALYHALVDRNAYGAITNVTDIDGTGLDHNATFTYDGGARLINATIGSGAGQHAFSYAYDGLQNMITRNGAGNGTLVGQYRYGEPLVAGGTPRGPRQLTSIDTGSGIVSFEYDGAGRQTRQGAITVDYNGLDQLVRVSGVPGTSGDVVHAYGYDDQRVFTQDPTGATQVWFTPNLSQTDGVRDHYVRAGDRLIARINMNWVGDPGGADTSPSGLMHVPEAPRRGPPIVPIALGFAVLAIVIRKQRSRWRVTPAILAAGAAAVGCNIFSSKTQTVWQVSQTTYYHQGIGAGPTLMTRADGSVLEERRFEPFGDDLDAYREPAGGGTGTSGLVDFAVEPHGITNKPTDPTTGWSYHGARWSAPETGRWLTPDPPVKAPDAKFMAKPWSLHPYQYVDQNPILYWDPDGKDVYFVVRTQERDVDIEAARTRVEKITKSASFDGKRDTVVELYVPDLGKLKSVIEAEVKLLSPAFGRTKELTVIGHAARDDGPIGHLPTSQFAAGDGHQMSKAGWASINFNWSSDSIAAFTACNTYPWIVNTFRDAQPDVRWAAGYAHWSFFSQKVDDWAPWHESVWDRTYDHSHPDIYPIGTASDSSVGRKLRSLFHAHTIIPMDAISDMGQKATVWPATGKDYVLEPTEPISP